MPVCSINLGFSVETLILVLVWGTYYVPATYTVNRQVVIIIAKVLLHTHSAHYYQNYNPYRGGKDVRRTVSLQNKEQCGHYMYHCDQ